MEYIEKEQGAYNLHIIKTDTVKTIMVKVFFREEVKKENLIKRYFLTDLLLLSTKKYPSKALLTKALQNLYAAVVRTGSRRLGNYFDTSFTLRVLQDKYTEVDNFKKSVGLLSSIIFDPNVVAGAFNKKDFETIYEEYKADLKTLTEDRQRYALIRLLEETLPDVVAGVKTADYEAYLDALTCENLYQYYQEMIKHNLIDIYVIGNVDSEEVASIFREAFPVNTFKARRIPALLAPRGKGKVKTVEEQLVGSQTILALSLNTSELTEYERNYPLSIYNTILGGGGMNSLLFTEVREKASLAYSIRSRPNKLDHLILITGGITAGKEKEVLSIIKKQLKKLEKGSFSLAMIEQAKEYYTTALDDILESPGQIIESYYMMTLLGVDDLETKRKKMLAVTKEEIVKVAAKVKIDTIYLLKGEEANVTED